MVNIGGAAQVGHGGGGPQEVVDVEGADVRGGEHGARVGQEGGGG